MTTRNPNVEYDSTTGSWQFKPSYGIQATKPAPLPEQWNPPVTQLEFRLRQIEKNQQTLLQVFGSVAKAVTELAKRPGLTAEDVSKLLQFSEDEKATIDALLIGNIISRIQALENP